MSVKSRTDKINNATQSISITRKSQQDGLSGIYTGQRTYRWNLKRLSNQTIKFGKREVTAIVYESDCVTWNEVQGDILCKGNNHSHTCCYHTIAAYQEAMRLSGYRVHKVDNPRDAYKLMNLGCSFVKIISNGGGAVTLAVKRNGTDQAEALDNLKELIDQKRMKLEPKSVMPVAYQVELFRRKNDTLVFKSGYTTSEPIARLGRDYGNRSGAYVGKWKLTADAEKNWQEFISKVKPKLSFVESVNLLRGEKEMGIE